jgi:hypothetical protein
MSHIGSGYSSILFNKRASYLSANRVSDGAMQITQKKIYKIKIIKINNSTNYPYSNFINLPPTLHNVMNLQFLKLKHLSPFSQSSVLHLESRILKGIFKKKENWTVVSDTTFITRKNKFTSLWFIRHFALVLVRVGWRQCIMFGTEGSKGRGISLVLYAAERRI